MVPAQVRVSSACFDPGSWEGTASLSPTPNPSWLLKKMLWEFPLWLRGLRTQLVSTRMRVWSLALLNGLRIWHCHEWWCGSDLVLLWLWYRLTAITPNGPLSWEPPYAIGVALKRERERERERYAVNYYEKNSEVSDTSVPSLRPPSGCKTAGWSREHSRKPLSTGALHFQRGPPSPSPLLCVLSFSSIGSCVTVQLLCLGIGDPTLCFGAKGKQWLSHLPRPSLVGNGQEPVTSLHS